MGSLLNVSRAAARAAVGILALGYLFNTFGAISDKLNWLLKLSPFYYAPSIDPLVLHQLTWWYPWVLVIVGLVCGIAGLIIFNRRDFPTPRKQLDVWTISHIPQFVSSIFAKWPVARIANVELLNISTI